MVNDITEVLHLLVICEMMPWYFYFARIGLQSTVMSMSVCLSAHVTWKLRDWTLNFYECCLWPWPLAAICNMLCTSGFTDYVMFSYHWTNGWMGMALCGWTYGSAGGHGRWPDAGHWLGGQACWGGWAGRIGRALRSLTDGWTQLLPGMMVHILPCTSLL